jgi:hypothetical protein
MLRAKCLNEMREIAEVLGNTPAMVRSSFAAIPGEVA